jgi:hypothetical protein
MKVTMRQFLSIGLTGLIGIALMTAGCSTGTQTGTSTHSSSTSAASSQEITPVRDQRALDELKRMSETLAAARSMSFESSSMTPLRGPNGQWVHVFKTARVEMQRPDRLFIQTGGDAFKQNIYFNGKTYTTFAPESKLYASTPMAGSIDAMLARSDERGGDVFPFSDALLADPYAAWSQGLEGALYVGQSNRNGHLLSHLAFTAKDMDWEVWVGVSDHLPHMVFVKYKGEDRSPTILIEFSKWRLNPKLNAAEFTFVPPRGARAANFKTPASQSSEGEKR